MKIRTETPYDTDRVREVITAIPISALAARPGSHGGTPTATYA
ncbi:hypothetical protein [Streptomyces sp. JJ66]|nr:hypothetical protein [Streptomyces sp. JJ66]